jgi:hypothetical protein
MILPTKGLGPERCLFGLGGEVLSRLRRPLTVAKLWEAMAEENRSFNLTWSWFVLTLDLLFMLGLIRLHRGRLIRVEEGMTS